MNTLCPGAIKKINTSGAGFKLMENIVVLQVCLSCICKSSEHDSEDLWIFDIVSDQNLQTVFRPRWCSMELTKPTFSRRMIFLRGRTWALSLTPSLPWTERSAIYNFSSCQDKNFFSPSKTCLESRYIARL